MKRATAAARAALRKKLLAEICTPALALPGIGAELLGRGVTLG